MSYPKGVYWQELRGMALDAIPSETRYSLNSPLPLSKWYLQGAYSLDSATKNSYSLTVSSEELGCALISDAEFYLDHAVEHQVSISSNILSDYWHSPAWMLVTFYYWCYFSATAITRMIGETVWFHTGDVREHFKNLLPTGNVCPGSGSFRVKCGKISSVTHRELHLYQMSGRPHEDLWKLFFQTCDALHLRHGEKNSSLEARLFAVITRSCRVWGHNWPIELRNAVNYRPGVGYDFVRKTGTIGGFGFINKGGYSIEEAVSEFEIAVSSAVRKDILQDGRSLFRMLVLLSVLLSYWSVELHGEIIDRNGLDSRWRHIRRNFIRENGIKVRGSSYWPMVVN